MNEEREDILRMAQQIIREELTRRPPPKEAPRRVFTKSDREFLRSIGIDPS